MLRTFSLVSKTKKFHMGNLRCSVIVTNFIVISYERGTVTLTLILNLII
jgi:hypothetical protein